MKAFDRKLFKTLAVFGSVAGVSSLIALPGIAELNPQSRDFKQSGDRVFQLAQTSPDASDSPLTPETAPSNLNDSDSSPNSPNNPANNLNDSERSPNAPNTPGNNNNNSQPSPSAPNAPANNNNNPGRSPTTPNTPNNNNNPGGSSNTPGGQNSTNSLSTRDRNFVLQAAQNGMLEMELGRLAVQRGSSAAVKQHGQQMVQEHTQANQELMQLAMQKGVEVPREMSSQNQALRQRLAGLSGASFDTAYQQAMRDSHSRAIALFQAQSQQGQDPELRAWATQLLPDLQAHLQRVNQLSQNPQQNIPQNTRQQ